MNLLSFFSILSTVTDPLFLAGVVIVAGYFAARYWLGRSSLARFLIQFLVFVILTGLLLAGGVGSYRPRVAIGPEARRLFVGALEVIWWLSAAWVAGGFLRAFVVVGGHARESELVPEPLARPSYLLTAL